MSHVSLQGLRELRVPWSLRSSHGLQFYDTEFLIGDAIKRHYHRYSNNPEACVHFFAAEQSVTGLYSSVLSRT